MPVDVGETTIGFPVPEYDEGPDQEYVLPPDAVSVTDSPEQMDVLEGVMLNEEALFTFTVMDAAGLLHPLLVPTTE